MGTTQAAKLIETQQEVDHKLLVEALRESEDRNETVTFHLEETLTRLDSLMADERGWTNILTGTDDSGPSLEQLKRRSIQLREAVTLNPHMRNGAELLANRVWSDTPRYSGVPGLHGESTGSGTPNVGKYVTDPVNIKNVFGTNARRERARAEFTDGLYLLLGENSTRRLTPIPLSEITGHYANPDVPSEVWAYRRQWNRWDAAQKQMVPVIRWYFTDLFSDKATTAVITETGESQQVDSSKTILDLQVNGQIGWTFGFPDGGSVLEWARIYSEFMKSGKKMTDSMARLWAQYKPTSNQNGTTGGVKMADMEGFGNSAIASGTLTPLSTAGQAYDFQKGVQILAVVAAGLGVSVISLSANPGDAGGSYGAAQTLSLPERLATQSRRNIEAEFDERILRWMGAKKPRVEFAVLVDGAEIYRLTQAVSLKNSTGLYDGDEAKADMEQVWGNVGEVADVPDGYMIPNNSNSAARIDVDPNGSAFGAAPKQAGGAGQGQSTGGGTNPNPAQDTRTDTVA